MKITVALLSSFLLYGKSLQLTVDQNIKLFCQVSDQVPVIFAAERRGEGDSGLPCRRVGVKVWFRGVVLGREESCGELKPREEGREGANTFSCNRQLQERIHRILNFEVTLGQHNVQNFWVQ